MSSVNANPTCRHCGRAMVWIGIAGGADPCCPKDCGACKKCNAPANALEVVSVEIEQLDVYDPYFMAFAVSDQPLTVTTFVCTRCANVTKEPS